MKRYFIIIPGVLIGLIFVVIGYITFGNADNEWKRGNYFFKTYGYIGSIESMVEFEIHYINVKDEDDDFQAGGTELFLVDDQNDEFLVENVSELLELDRKLYKKKSLIIRVNLETGIYNFTKLKIIRQDYEKEIDIGKITVEVLESNVNYGSPGIMMAYGSEFVYDEYKITIRNFSENDIVINDVRMESDILIKNYEENYLLVVGETKNFSTTLDRTNLTKFDIVVLKPSVLYTNYENQLHINIVVILIKDQSILVDDDIFEFVNEYGGE